MGDAGDHVAGERFVWPWLVLALAWMLLLNELLLAEPGTLPVPKAPSLLWNLGHAALYAPLGALLFLGMPKTHLFVVVAVLVAGVHGIVLEMLQGSIPGRSSDPFDAATDLFGAALGVAMLSWLLARRREGASLRPVLLLLVLATASAVLASV